MGIEKRSETIQPLHSQAEKEGGLSRRDFFKIGGVAGAAPAIAGAAKAGGKRSNHLPGEDLREKTIAELQQMMDSGSLSSAQLTRYYLNRIRTVDGYKRLNAVLQTNPDAMAIAQQLDDERAQQGPRGPLHGVPIMLKDNIDTGDSMMTTAGSLALAGAPALQDATVADRLRAAGAVILGKLNLSEWANFRGFDSSSGWSGVGGQCKNPYILDRNPCGSSSGTGAAVSSNLCAAGLGTETDGSIVCPAAACGVVGIKPTVGLTSRAGVVPISATQDTVGVHGRTVADAAAVLGPLTGVDPRDAATAASDGNSFTDYSQFVDPNGLAGARIGVAREFQPTTTETDIAFEGALQAMRDAGAEVIDVAIPSFNAFGSDSSEVIVLVYEFKRDLNAYLATRSGVPVQTMADVIEFNLANFEAELLYFGQEWFEFAEAEIFSEAQYQQALIDGPNLAGAQGIDATLADFNVDAIVAPTNSPAWPNDLVTGDSFQFGTSAFAAVAGYPLVTVPGGNAFGLPLGVTFMASAWSEPTLIRLASGFEAAAQARQQPRFQRTLIRERGLFEYKRAQARARLNSSRRDLQQAMADFLKPKLRKPFYL